MSFQEKIQNWVSLDNQIRILTDKTKELRSKKNDTCDEILTYVTTNKLDNAVVQISDGRLKFVETKQQQPLTYKFVEECLINCIGDQVKVKQIINYMKQNRETKVVPDIKRTYNKIQE